MPMTVKYSVGYNYDMQLLKVLEIFKDNVESLYFPIPQRFMGSGRALIETENYEKQIPGIIERCKELKIRPQLLMNATCEGKNLKIEKIIDNVKSL